jgi:N-(2-amino-2-carboxyethyl)-L-glutamate synthase
MILSSIADCVGNTPLVKLSRAYPGGPEVLAKLEFLNPGGSVKDRPARYILDDALQSGRIHPGGTIVECSSGNFGVALAILARIYDLQLICVVDPKITQINLCLLHELGARVEMVDTLDCNGGYLLSRLARVNELVSELPGAYPVSQHTNALHWRCHYESLADELICSLASPPDVFVAAVSTTATLVGVGRRLREVWPRVTIVAADAVGSVLFGGTGGERQLPGIGSSRHNSFFADDLVDHIVYVDDREAITSCRHLLQSEGILAGGSSGAVLAAIDHLYGPAPSRRILTILPDRGERYVNLIYDGLGIASSETGAVGAT